MLPIIGIVVVFGAVVTGFLMEKGHLLVLFQPSEIVTIVGAAAALRDDGSILASSRVSADSGI